MSWLGATNRAYPMAAPVNPNSIVWAPGHIARTTAGKGGNRNTPLSAANTPAILAAMDAIIADDVNNQIKHFMFHWYWAQLESPSGGVYDGSWDGSGNSGFAAVQQLLTKAKSYNPPRGICMLLNCTGNGLGTTNNGFPSFYAPTYLNSTTYGPRTGVEWNVASGQSGGTPVITFWNQNTAARIVALVQAYYNNFGPHSATSGLYMWDLFSEISIASAYSYTSGAFVSAAQNVYFTGPSSGIRGAAPQQMFVVRPTFINTTGGPSATDYTNLYNAMQSSFIAVGEEDSSNKGTASASNVNPTDNWGAQAYRGASGTFASSMPNHVAAGDWAFVCNTEDAEYYPNGSNPPPPAHQGSGVIYDNRPTYAGVMSGDFDMQASHHIWYMDVDGTNAPNVSAGPGSTSPSRPANPSQGPNPGSSTVRPNLVDLITNNPAYSSLGLKPMPISNTTKPPGWP